MAGILHTTTENTGLKIESFDNQAQNNPTFLTKTSFQRTKTTFPCCPNPCSVPPNPVRRWATHQPKRTALLLLIHKNNFPLQP
jgi:hypothetical protein